MSCSTRDTSSRAFSIMTLTAIAPIKNTWWLHHVFFLATILLNSENNSICTDNNWLPTYALHYTLIVHWRISWMLLIGKIWNVHFWEKMTSSFYIFSYWLYIEQLAGCCLSEKYEMYISEKRWRLFFIYIFSLHGRPPYLIRNVK